VAKPLLCVVGSANVDYVTTVATLPVAGETVLAGDLVTTPGGKGANQAVAIAKLGGHARFIGKVGTDAAGDWTLNSLQNQGVDTSHVGRSSRPTGSAFITVDAAGENTIVVAPGANAEVNVTESDVADAEVVVAQMEISPSTVEAAIELAPRMVLNLAPARQLPMAALQKCAAIIVNETEAQSLDLSALPLVVVTLGAQGAALYRHGEQASTATPPRVTPVDTVGAGDAFVGAFAMRLALGDTEDLALRYAVVAGAIATQKVGAQASLPTHQEILTWQNAE
jgi:ribokinase